MKLKKCTKCCQKKPYSEFTKDRQKHDGYRSDCKNCRYGRNKEYIEIGFKKCIGKNGCGIIKLLSEFSLRSDNQKYRNQCKECRAKYFKKYDVSRKRNTRISKECILCNKTKPVKNFFGNVCYVCRKERTMRVKRERYNERYKNEPLFKLKVGDY